MLSPYSLDTLVAARQADLEREACAERLASQVRKSRGRPTFWRSRAAEVLYGLAVRLDPCAVPSSAPSTRPA
jgi:hypothetical protein